MRYIFPENKRGARCTVKQQIAKIREEAKEIEAAYKNVEGDDRIIEETWDCIQACESLLRKYPRLQVLKVKAIVKIKSFKRGDYEK